MVDIWFNLVAIWFNLVAIWFNLVTIWCQLMALVPFSTILSYFGAAYELEKKSGNH